MGFTSMDGFFLSIFLAVCIVVAVVIRCLCYRLSCVRQLLSGEATSPSDEVILPRTTAPVIAPAGVAGRSPALALTIPDSPTVPQHGAVFTIYTFPQQDSPDIRRPSCTPEPPKYASLPQDSPPKYEDLFPLADFSIACKDSNISCPDPSCEAPDTPPGLVGDSAPTQHSPQRLDTINEIEMSPTTPEPTDTITTTTPPTTRHHSRQEPPHSTATNDK